MNGSQEQVDATLQTPMPAPQPAASAPTPPVANQAPPVAGRPSQMPRKSPFLACALSLLPGVGQVYVGYYKLGFVHNLVFGGSIAVIVAISATEGGFSPLAPLVSVFLAFFVVYNVVDAGRRAVHYNVAVDGGQHIDMPELNTSLPSFGGSIGAGVALVLGGFILLLNTLFGVSLSWIADWWPLAPMAFGAYLVMKALQDRRQDTSAGNVGSAGDGDSLDTPSPG